MASEATVVSGDGQWKIEVEAWKNNFLVYKSIGTQVDVYHREQTKNVWGNTKTDWVKKRASSIHIRNTYRGTGPGVGVREKRCAETASCELKEWAVGVTVTIPVESPTDVGGGAILEIESVEGAVTVSAGGQTMTATVSASSALSDSSIW